MNKIVILLLFPIISFSQCCDYILSMQDSYGDGWNGATIELFVNNGSIGVFAAEDFSSNINFETCSGDQISVLYSSGEWENENSYVLLSDSGSLIFASNLEPKVGNSGPFEVNCNLLSNEFETPCSAVEILIDECLDLDNSGIEDSGYVANCANYNGGDVWNYVIVPESGNIVFQTNNNGGMNDTGIQIWNTDYCFPFEVLACDDDSGNGYFSYLNISNLIVGDTIYIQTWGYGGGTGSYELCVFDPGIVDLYESLLPIIIINTDGEEIPDEPKIGASLQIIYNGPNAINNINDDPNNYDGLIGIERRGASSFSYPQRPYAFETRNDLGENNNVSLIDMPQENDWILISNYNDKVLMRNLLGNHLFEKMGQYAPRNKLCEVLLNNNYEGIYVLSEKIKVDNERVNIASLSQFENEGDDLTGGYILELNYWNMDNSWELNYAPLNFPYYDIHLTYDYPKAINITEQQKEYISSYVDSMETALYGADFMSLESGYRNFLDVESFIDYFLISEISRNNDGFKKSRYFHKNKDSNGGLFKAGPTWDFDWAWKDMNACTIFSNQDGSGWAHLINTCSPDNYSPDWYIRMQEDSTYVNQTRCRWEEYRADFLNESYINNFIDSIAFLVNEAKDRHFQKWPILGIATASPEIEPLPETFQGEIDFFKNWIFQRINWLDQNLPGFCQGSTWSCINTYCVDPGDGTGVYSNLADCQSNCTNFSSIHNITESKEKRIIKIVDLLGREITVQKNLKMFYIYDDGSVEKKYILE